MKFSIPLERLTIRASRSGGPGGQNVNKVSSRVEVRFPLSAADWIPAAIRSRLRELYPRRVTLGGDFRVESSRFRNQAQNLKDCLEKLEGFLSAAAERPPPRIPTGPSMRSRQKRLEAKRRRGAIKRSRKTGGGED